MGFYSSVSKTVPVVTLEYFTMCEYLDILEAYLGADIGIGTILLVHLLCRA